MSENRTGKYLKYAIGEIILVVIGILIALQINNWNENRKARLEEQILLKRVYLDFTANLKQLDQKIMVRNKMLKAAKVLFSLIDNPDIRNVDTLDVNLARTIVYSTFDPIENDLAASGELTLIKNTDLKKALTNWTSDIKDVTEDEEIWKNYRNNLYVPFLIENYQLRTLRNKAFKNNVLGSFGIDRKMNTTTYTQNDIGFSKHQVDFNSLLNNPNFEDHLSRCYSINSWANQQSSTLRARLIEIIGLIENEIDSN